MAVPRVQSEILQRGMSRFTGKQLFDERLAGEILGIADHRMRDRNPDRDRRLANLTLNCDGSVQVQQIEFLRLRVDRNTYDLRF